MAEPSAPIVRTRLRNNPPKRNTTKKQRRSHTISREILPGEKGQSQTDGDADDTQDRSDQRGGRVFLRDQVHHDHDDQPVGNVVGQDRDGCGETGQSEAERCTASSRGRRELAAEKVEEAGGAHRSTERQVPLTVATAEAPMRKESSGLSTLMRIGKARRETDPIKRALDARQSVDACAVLRQHRPTEPNDSAAEVLAGLRLQIKIHRRPRRDVP